MQLRLLLQSCPRRALRLLLLLGAAAAAAAAVSLVIVVVDMVLCFGQLVAKAKTSNYQWNTNSNIRAAGSGVSVDGLFRP